MSSGESLSLEERKHSLDAEIRLRELALREAEARKGGLSSAQATVAGAIFALIGGVVGSGITAWNTRGVEESKSLTSLQIEEMRVKGTLDLERSKQVAVEALERNKFETTLIFEAIKAPTREDAIRNLKFFVNAGFIQDEGGRISKLDDKSLPSLAEPSKSSAERTLKSTGLVAFEGTKCTGVAISPASVITAGVCVKPIKGTVRAEDPAVFTSGGKKYRLDETTLNVQGDLAMLSLSGDEKLPTFMDASLVRRPSNGERVYLAISVSGEGAELRTCNVLGVAESEFRHDCITGPGSAGALVIAVSDNALLGLHYSRSPDRNAGIASHLSGKTLLEFNSKPTASARP